MKKLKLKRIIISFLCLLLLGACLIGCTDTDQEPVDSTVDITDTTVSTTDADDTKETTETTKPSSTKKEPLNMWTYTVWDSLKVRELTFDVGLSGEEVTVIQLTDLHFKAFTEEDLENPTLKSTYENRTSFSVGETVPNIQKALDYADRQNPDQIVLTGDNLDCLSQGAMNLMKEHIWDRYREDDGEVRKVMACLGNHEASQQMTGTVEESISLDERLNMLEEFWEHDIYYSSKVIKNKVMLIQMWNCQSGEKYFWDGQAEKLSADIAAARANGYTVLLFCHAPMNTYDTRYYSTLPLIKRQGAENLYNNNKIPGPFSTGTDGEVYNIITNSADVIAGVFNGHYHSDYYSEIKAKTADGIDKSIPQYTLCSNSHDGGHVLKITIK